MPAARLAEMVAKYPKLPVVFVHMMFPDIEVAFKLLDDYPELTLDATNCFAPFRPEFKQMLELWGSATKLRDIFFEGICGHKGRVLIGSDHPAGMGTIEEIYRDVFEFGFPEDVLKSLLEDAPANFVKSFVPEYRFDNGL